MLGFTWKAALVLALICLALAAWTLRDVLMALFGAFILANGMSLAAKTLAHKTGLRYALAAGIVIMACMATLGAAFWFFGATLIEQVDELRQKIPDGAEWIRRQIEARSYMRDALSNLDFADLSGPTGWLARNSGAQGDVDSRNRRLTGRDGDRRGILCRPARTISVRLASAGAASEL